jgi:hypothetical protein
MRSMTLALMLAACGGPTMIRAHNASDLDWTSLVVGTHAFGDLQADATTEYVEFEGAYHYNYVELTADGTDFVLQPIDYVGETPLGSGHFTYEIDITDFDGAALSIEAVRD